MFERIMTVSGKPGLYRLLSSGRNMFVVEAVDATHKRMPVYNSDKVVMLDDIAIYTDTEELPLRKVFSLIYTKEKGILPFDLKLATPEELTNYFAEILPDYDRERVYLTHIKKLFSWYNILVAGGVTDFEEAEEVAESNE